MKFIANIRKGSHSVDSGSSGGDGDHKLHMVNTTNLSNSQSMEKK